MWPPDDSALLHATKPYDPQKAREYYLRTRELKGRKSGSKETPIGRRPAAPSKQKSHPKASNLRLVAESRQASLEVRLNNLRDVLAKLLEKAKEGIDTETKSDPATKKTSDSKSSKQEPLTGAAKAKAAKASKDYYEKNKEPSAKDDEKLKERIEEVRQKILKIREELKAAIEKARQQSQSKTVPKGR